VTTQPDEPLPRDALLDATDKLQEAADAYNRAMYGALAITIERASAMSAQAVLRFIGTQVVHTELLQKIVEDQADKKMILRDINERLNALEAKL
jgi:hypothetical protein